MSLSGILNTASAALTNVDFQISVSNTNLANAGDTSYSRKTVTVSALTSDVLLNSSNTSRVTDAYLTKTVVSTGADAARDQAISTILQNYDDALGNTSDGNDVSSRLTALQTALTNISAQGGDASSKGTFVSAANQLASGIRSLSSTIQTLRSEANSQIGDTVSDVNQLTSQIASLNKQIISAQANGNDVSNLEDQRDAALQSLSSDIGVSYYVTPQNTMEVYDTAGDLLVSGQTATPMSYSDGSNALAASTTYPGGIKGITLGGKDITTSISSGKLGGLISLRDQTLPAEQAKLDTLSQGLISTMNTVSNAGSAYPPPTSLTGTRTVSASDLINASGTLTVTLTNATGAVDSTQQIDLSGLSGGAPITVQQLMDQLNAIPGLQAQINGQGQLALSTTNGDGVALSGGTLSSASASSPPNFNVSGYFGLNDIFTGANGADIAVKSTLTSNPSLLATASLNTSAGAGAIAVAAGDTTNVDALNNALTGTQSFAASGGFPAQSTSLQNYATSFVSGAASIVSTASTTAQTSQATFTAAQTKLQNETNVNTNEELANLQTLEQQYQANAQMISTVRTLFTALIQMMG